MNHTEVAMATECSLVREMAISTHKTMDTGCGRFDRGKKSYHMSGMVYRSSVSSSVRSKFVATEKLVLILIKSNMAAEYLC